MTDEDKVVIQHVLQRSAKERFPRLRAILLWNVSFKEEKNRTDREIKSVCEELKRKRASLLLFFPLVNLTDVSSTLSSVPSQTGGWSEVRWQIFVVRASAR